MLTLDSLLITQGDFSLRADWSVATRETVALIGPSGAGKSTLLSVIAGFFPAAEGRVLWDGNDLAGRAPGARPIAMLFQDGNLFPHLTAAQNVGLGIRPDLRLSRGDRDRVSEALDRVGLADYGPRRPAEMSGGQQSRVALARVLVQDRPLLLLDEPFGALGPALRAEMLDLVARICADKGATLVMVSHAPEDAHRIADRIVLVDEGVADAPRDTAEAFAAPTGKLARYLG